MRHSIQETYLEVGDGHSLYIHDWGNKTARLPILFLHGGPGGGCSDGQKQLFDPASQRVIFFDQRGSGKSLPKGSLDHNTTDDLIEDINKITDHLNVKTFIINGGSWGACLALAYSLKYPQKVHAIVLRGIFTGSQRELDWLDKGEYRHFFPDVWSTFFAATPKQYQNNPNAYHYAQALGTDELAAKKSIYAYANVEGALLSLDDRYKPDAFEDFDPAGERIEIHYLANKCFMPNRHILDNAHILNMPIWLVQGRYDFVCPRKLPTNYTKSFPTAILSGRLAATNPNVKAGTSYGRYCNKLQR